MKFFAGKEYLFISCICEHINLYYIYFISQLLNKMNKLIINLIINH